MTLQELLEDHRAAILAEATEGLSRARLRSYEKAGVETGTERLRTLYDLVLTCVRGRHLVPIVEHAERVARERYEAGYDFREVHAAFNVLEEALWRHAIATMPKEDLAEAIGMAGTVLGAGKEALAAEYIEQASDRKAPSLDLSRLFSGTN